MMINTLVGLRMGADFDTDPEVREMLTADHADEGRDAARSRAELTAAAPSRLSSSHER